MSESIAVENKYCPDCKCHVQAQCVPDEVETDKLVWQCLQCGCGIEFVEI